MLEIRPFIAEDYEGVAWVLAQAYPDAGFGLESLVAMDAGRDPQSFCLRLVAKWGWELVGVVNAHVSVQDNLQSRAQLSTQAWGDASWSGTVLRLEFDLTVRPDHAGRGIGSALMQAFLEHLDVSREYVQTVGLITRVDERDERKLRFLSHWGFAEAMRGYAQYLNVSEVDLSRFGDLEGELRRHGCEIVSLREFAAEPSTYAELYELFIMLERDVPRVEDDLAEQSFDRFVHEQIGAPDGVFIAVSFEDRPRYVGVNALYAHSGSHDLHNGLTGVLSEYRGRGLALALKCRGIRFAQENGFPTIHTWNAATNTAALALNAKLGFIRRPATIELRRWMC